MDIVSLDDPVVPDASVQENVYTSYGNEALEIQAGDEITHGHKLTCSQSTIEYDNSGDSKRRGAGPRSKSFLEEPSRSKATLFMQRKPGGKEPKSTYGSHGDGICLWPSWDISKGFTGSDSKEKADQEKKLQIVFTDTSTQAGGVTQKLFDSNVTFADLVRVYTTQENNVHSCRVQLGNTLLSTVHASTLVSNYLNTYRSYLDYLRKTCGRGDSHEQLSSPRAPPKSVPLFLPLAGMTSVFSDDSKEDPEFLELLKKTTTESIRKLWPHSNKNYIRTSALTDTSENKDEESVPGIDNVKTDSGSTEAFTDTSLQQFSDTPECESNPYSNDEGQISNADRLKLFKYSYMCDSQLTRQEDSNISTNNPNYTMKFSSESVLIGDGDSANVQSITSAEVQKGLLEASSDTQASVDNLYKNASTGPMVLHSNTSGLSSWGSLGQQKCSNESNGQQSRPSTLDTLLQHQQKLAQQQQLQRQMMQHQQHLQQQRQQQQQLFQQYQQQEQQRQQSEQFSAAKSYCFQSSSDPSKNWLHTVGDGSGMTSYRPCLSGTSQSTSSYTAEPVISHQSSLDSFGTSYQMNTDYFVSNSGQCLPTRASHMDAPTNCFPETSTHTRTLKASYACLDPSNPMTLSVDPLHDYNESDLFMNHCDMSMYDRQSFSNLPSTFGPSFDDRANCPEPSRMWAKMSRPVSSFNENDNSGKTLEERLRKAYAKSRGSQFAQPGQWNDTSRLSVQRPIVKINTVSDMNEDNQSYPFQRGLLDSGRRAPSSTANIVCNQDRWNRLVCSESLETNGNDCVVPNSSGMGDDKGMAYMPIQTSTAADANPSMSRLFQWKQDTPSSNKSSFFPAPRSPGGMSSFSPNDSVVHSLLSGLQLDRDFSWNASSISSQMPSHPAQNSLFQCNDGQDSNAGHCKLSDSSVGKLSSLSADQRRQLSNNNNAAAASAGLSRAQSDQVNDSDMYYDSGETKHNTWSLKNRQEMPGDQVVSGLNSIGSGPILSPSMQILNKKILLAQSNIKNHNGDGSSGNSCSDGDSPNGKELDKIQSRTSTPSSIDSQSTDNISKRRLSRAFGDAMSNVQTQASTSNSQLSAVQQQARQNVDNPVFKLSEDLEKTFLEDIPNTTPWHELTSQESIDNDFSIENGNNDNKYIKMTNFSSSSMAMSDQEAVTLRSADTNRIYNVQQGTKDQRMQSALSGGQVLSNQQGTTAPRMILGANSVKQANEDKVKSDVEESNRRLRQMLGLAPSKDQCSGVNVAGVRLQESSQIPPQTPSPGIMSMGQLSGPYTQTSSPMATGQMPRMQVAGGKIQTSVGLAQQMYCVPNILMPPPQVQPQGATRQSNMIPIQGVMTSIASGSRFPQGMIQVPFVDMSRLVYVHQVPVSMASVHPSNNNHNNSSSSNPHVNTSNIITINTSDNDFSAGGQGDKSGRHIRTNPGKNKTTFLKLRSGSEEFAVPIIGVRPPLDDGMCPRLIKSRTNPWDQDLDHDFSNSLMSKTVSIENMAGACASSVTAEAGFGNPELGGLYPDITNIQGGGQAGIEQTAKTATFMQWPAAADIHPEMLDMLPMRRAVPEDCGSGRLCWPDMEFLMSSREQLQSARRSNKPVGSNKANLISIIPKENATDGIGGVKETRFEKLDNKIA